MGFSRQEYWSGLPFPPPRDLTNPGIERLFLKMLNRYIIVDWVFLGINILDFQASISPLRRSVFPSLDDSAGVSQRLVKKGKEMDDQRQKLFLVSYPVLCILGFTCSQVASMTQLMFELENYWCWVVPRRHCNYCDLQKNNRGGPASSPFQTFQLTLVFLISCVKSHDLWTLHDFRI